MAQDYTVIIVFLYFPLDAAISQLILLMLAFYFPFLKPQQTWMPIFELQVHLHPHPLDIPPQEPFVSYEADHSVYPGSLLSRLKLQIDTGYMLSLTGQAGKVKKLKKHIQQLLKSCQRIEHAGNTSVFLVHKIINQFY